MQATVGDHLIVHGRIVGQSDRTGEIIDVRGQDGAPPYLVRFSDGHESVIFPGPDCVIEHTSTQG
jgi:hypothetical protein